MHLMLVNKEDFKLGNLRAQNIQFVDGLNNMATKIVIKQFPLLLLSPLATPPLSLLSLLLLSATRI